MKKLITLFFFALSLSAFATSVTFKVSMKGSGMECDSVFIVGNHTDWAFVQMADEGDSLYSVTLNLTETDTVVYYYITIGWWAADYLDWREIVPTDCDQSAELMGWEGDRAFIVPAEALTVAYVWGTCDEPEGPSAIENTENSYGFELYPNPCKDVLNITLPEEMNQAYVDILDISGKKILSARKSVNSRAIDISDLSEGIYLVRVNDGSRTFVNKLIVQ